MITPIIYWLLARERCVFLALGRQQIGSENVLNRIYDTIRYEMLQVHFNVQSKADMSQLNLPYGTSN